MPREAPVTSAIRSKRGGGISRYPGRAKRAADSLEPISKSFEEDDEAGKLDKAEEIVGVVLPANEDPALPLNLTFCAIFARLYPSPIYSPREHTLVCWSKPTCWTHRRWFSRMASACCNGSGLRGSRRRQRALCAFA